jgi:hypothetical protein
MYMDNEEPYVQSVTTYDLGWNPDATTVLILSTYDRDVGGGRVGICVPEMQMRSAKSCLPQAKILLYFLPHSSLYRFQICLLCGHESNQRRRGSMRHISSSLSEWPQWLLGARLFWACSSFAFGCSGSSLFASITCISRLHGSPQSMQQSQPRLCIVVISKRELK